MGNDLEIQRLSAPPAYQLVSRELRRLILTGSLKPGDTFPSELALVDKLGVNRSTIREGIRHLEADGLVSRVGRRRLFVSIPDSSKIAPRARDAMVLSKVTFLELWEVSRVVEPLSARLAAIHRTTSHLEALEENLKKFRCNMEIEGKDYDIDIEFHNIVAEATGNVALLLTREPVSQLLFPASHHIKPSLPQARRRELKAHEEIYYAIGRQDPDEAEMWMARHIGDLKRGWKIAGLPYNFKIDPGMKD
jgi:GntR family transcriptional regulator, transcriptional repressor for pyruvate dehydrogenase complex